MKHRLFILALLCYLCFLSPYCEAETYDWFTLNDKVNHFSNIQANFYQHIQTGKYNREGQKTDYGSSRWSNIVFCFTDKDSNRRFKKLFLPGIYFISDGTLVGFGLSDMWFSYHYNFLKNMPFAARIALKLKGHDSENLLRQNDIDLGFLYGKGDKNKFIESSISYRYRFRGVKQHEFGFNYNKPGNELHYKLDVGKYYFPDLGFSGFILGYWGFDKHFNKKRIDNSNSSKLSVGARIHFAPPEKSIVSASFMIDLFGKNETAGWFFNLQFGK